MSTITLSPEVAKKFHDLLQEEGEGSCVRIREYKRGSACHAKLVLGMSIDEMDDMDDVLLAEIDGMKFIASEDFSDQYGKSFHIHDEDGMVVVTPKPVKE